MILLDSSGWIEILTAGPLVQAFRRRLEAAEAVVVPTIVLYEVYKFSRRESTERAANLAAAQLRRHTVVPLDDRLALEAADFSLEHRLPLADAIVYATARAYEATLVTGNEHFGGLPGVEYLARNTTESNC